MNLVRGARERSGSTTRLGSGRSAPRVPFALLVVGLLVGGLVLLLVLNTASAANELRRHSIAVKDDQVAADVQQLRNDVAASAAPGNLARAAEQLGMVPAGDPAFIVRLPDGRLVLRGHPGIATEAPLAVGPPAHKKHKKPKASSTPTKPASTSTSTSTKSPSGTKTRSTTTKSKHPGRATSTDRTKPTGTRTAPPSATSTPTPTITLGGNR